MFCNLFLKNKKYLGQNFFSNIKKICYSKNMPFKFSAIQFQVTDNKKDNINRARNKIEEAAKNGADFIALPECFNSPYGPQFFPQYAESIPNGETTEMLQSVAKDCKIYLVGGSIPEVESDGKLYNTSLVFDTEGKIIAKHRKVHLFDIDIPGKITFKESETLSAGNQITTFETEFCKVGVGICYDIRFPELAQLMANQQCKFLVYPGAFNCTTGPAHWKLLQRARAVDNQVFVATISPARNQNGYQAWGHSTIVDPWGSVIATCEEKEEIIYADIEINKVDEIRQQIPVTIQKRNDIYKLEEK